MDGGKDIVGLINYYIRVDGKQFWTFPFYNRKNNNGIFDSVFMNRHIARFRDN